MAVESDLGQKISKNCQFKHCSDIYVVVMIMLVLFIIYSPHLLIYFSFINLIYSFIHSFIFSFCHGLTHFSHWYRLTPQMHYIISCHFFIFFFISCFFIFILPSNRTRPSNKQPTQGISLIQPYFTVWSQPKGTASACSRLW